MNKEQIIKYLKNSIDKKGNYCYSLPIETTKAIIKYIDQLTNNWNELEKWCKNNLGYYGSDIGVIYKYVLDKMKEIKEGNNDIS